jgi:hypothetical protein
MPAFFGGVDENPARRGSKQNPNSEARSALPRSIDDAKMPRSVRAAIDMTNSEFSRPDA